MGLSGSQFLAVYASGTGAMLLITVVVRLLSGGRPGGRPARTLAPYEVGYLAGGAQRVAEMVIAEQVDNGAMRIARPGSVTWVDRTARTGPHADALNRITQWGIPDGLACYVLVVQLKSDPGIARIGHDLRAENLMIPGRHLAALRVTAVALIVALLTTGLLRLTDDMHHHRGIGFLVLFIFLSVLACAWLLSYVLNGSKRTHLGESYLRQLRKAPQVGLLAIALAGFRAVPGRGRY